MNARRLLIAAILPPSASFVVLALASILPVHLSDQAFPEWRRVEGLDLPSGVPALYVSDRTDTRQRHFYGFVLHGLAYPSRTYAWVVPEESRDTDSMAIGVAADGSLHGPGSVVSLGPAGEARLRLVSRTGVVLFDDDAARLRMTPRLPFLAGARTFTLRPPPTSPISRRRPASLLTGVRLLRLAALIGTAVALAGIASDFIPDGAPAFMAAAAAVPATAAILLWLFSWSQVLPFRSPGGWPYLAWAAGALVWAFGTGSRRLERPRVRFRAAAVLAIVLAVLAVQDVASLDFDEDAQSHWMVMAQSYEALGRHDAPAQTDHYLAGIYPYGYAAYLATAAWAADSEGKFPRPGDSTDLAVLVYRLAAAALAAGFFVLLAAELSAASGRVAFALAGCAFVAALFPILRGYHHAAETFLVPLLGSAMVLVAMGRRLESWALVATGLFVGAAATLLKLEGALLFAIAVLPWLAGEGSRIWTGRPFRTAAAVALGLLPLAIWKFGLPVRDTLYETPALSVLIARRRLALAILGRCGAWVFRNGWVVFLLGLAPAAWAGSRRSGSSPIVWFAGLAAFLLFPLVYVFSHASWEWQIDTSYSRIVLVPFLGIVLFTLERFAGWGPEPATEDDAR